MVCKWNHKIYFYSVLLLCKNWNCLVHFIDMKLVWLVEYCSMKLNDKLMLSFLESQSFLHITFIEGPNIPLSTWLHLMSLRALKVSESKAYNDEGTERPENNLLEPDSERWHQNSRRRNVGRYLADSRLAYSRQSTDVLFGSDSALSYPSQLM